MSGSGPVLCADRIETGLAGCGLGGRIEIRRETASTNDLAARLGVEGAPHGTIVFAETQSAGRGRFGRRWESPAGCGLWFSILLRPDLPEPLRPRLTLCTAVGLARGIEAVAGQRPPVGIKWPNDLLIGGRKVAGILLESRSGPGGFVVAGIGLNVNQLAEDFPPDLRLVAGSLRLAYGGCAFDREEVACAVLRALEPALASASSGFAEVVAECERRSVLIGCEVELRVGASILTGVATGIDPDSGALVLRLADGGYRRVAAGEVTVAGAGFGAR